MYASGALAASSSSATRTTRRNVATTVSRSSSNPAIRRSIAICSHRVAAPPSVEVWAYHGRACGRISTAETTNGCVSPLARSRRPLYRPHRAGAEPEPFAALRPTRWHRTAGRLRCIPREIRASHRSSGSSAETWTQNRRRTSMKRDRIGGRGGAPPQTPSSLPATAANSANW